MLAAAILAAGESKRMGQPKALVTMHGLSFVEHLIAAFDSGSALIVLPKYNGRRGHPVVFRATVYDELLAASAEVGARQVVWNHAAEVAEVETNEEGVIVNLNDPETLRRAIGR